MSDPRRLGLGPYVHPYANMMAEKRPIEIKFTPAMVEVIRPALDYIFAPRWPGSNTDHWWHTPGNRTRIAGAYVVHDGKATPTDQFFLETVKETLREAIGEGKLHANTLRAMRCRLGLLNELIGTDAITQLGEVGT